MGFEAITFFVFLVAFPIFCLSNGPCDPTTVALYKVTFQGLWTKSRFPKVYPESRPKAEWSSLIGRSHSDSYRMFSKGKLVSDKLRTFVEYGDTTKLVSEGQGHSLILDSFTSQPIEKGYGVSETQFYSDGDRSKISLTVKIVPSPDWFVGVDSFSLCQDGAWIDSANFDLWPLDAGSQQGYTFSSPRWRSDPQEVITEITNLHPNHTADAFYYPQLSSLPPIAKVGIHLVQLYRAEVSSTAAPVMAVTEEYIKPVINNKPLPRLINDGARETKPGAMVKPPVPHFMRVMDRTPATLPTTINTITSTGIDTTASFNRSTLTERLTTTEQALSTEEETATEQTTSTRVTPTAVVVINPKILVLLNQIRGGRTTQNPAATTTDEISTTHQPQSDSLHITTDNEIRDHSLLELLTTVNHTVNGLQEDTTTSTISTTQSYASNNILPPDYEFADTFDDKVCLVSAWTEWSECSRSCGYGVKTRSRDVIRWTGNVACPDLQMEQLCGSMKKCNWNHFSLKFNSTSSILSNKKRIRYKKPMMMKGENASALLSAHGGMRRPRKRLSNIIPDQ